MHRASPGCTPEHTDLRAFGRRQALWCPSGRSDSRRALAGRAEGYRRRRPGARRSRTRSRIRSHTLARATRPRPQDRVRVEFPGFQVRCTPSPIRRRRTCPPFGRRRGRRAAAALRTPAARTAATGRDDCRPPPRRAHHARTRSPRSRCRPGAAAVAPEIDREPPDRIVAAAFERAARSINLIERFRSGT